MQPFDANEEEVESQPVRVPNKSPIKESRGLYSMMQRPADNGFILN